MSLVIKEVNKCQVRHPLVFTRMAARVHMVAER